MPLPFFPVDPTPGPQGRRRGRAGSSLLIVLSLLALLLVLIVGFFSMATKMSSSSHHYASGVAAAALGESAVKMVTSQIRLAASGEPALTWTSQPGMLRTFDTSGKAQQIYKLYSSPAFSTSAAAYNESDDTPPATWNSTAYSSALYADINQPAYDASGDLVYPVVDPGAATANAATGRQPVTGFTLGTAPGYNAGSPASPTNNPAAMPVTWFYVLANGGVAVPQSVDANGNVTFATTAGSPPAAVPVPSLTNPVVGRVAFWTDDDTCKVNVNTAGYGANTLTSSASSSYMTYWSTPARVSQQEETFLSEDQPWTNEFQRYPGHPATTGLNLVFPELTMPQIFSLAPRIQPGGSVGGTVTTAGATALPVKQDRLYASVDELFYNATRNSSGTNLGALSVRDLDTKRFFLTAQSRAPELNLYGQPRVTIWPEWDIPGNRSTLDNTIAFCSTIGKDKFYFTRDDPTSQTTDINLSDSLGSNLKLYSYLQRMTNRQVPGFGGTANGFLDKYGADRNQILTSIFDTIRITNLAETGTAVPYTTNAAGHGNQVMGQVLPTVNPNGTRGAGRIFCINEASIVFVNTDSTANGTVPAVTDQSKVAMGILFKFYLPQGGAIAAGANLLYKVSGLSSFTVTANGSTQSIFPSDTWQHGSWEYNFASVYGGANMNINSLSDTYRSLPTDPQISSSLITYDNPLTSNVFPVGNGSQYGDGFTFNGGTMTVEIHSPYNDATPSSLIQTYTFTFPKITSKLPTPVYYPTQNNASGFPGPWNDLPAASQPPSSFTTTTPKGVQSTKNGRFYQNSANSGPWIGQKDVTRSLQLSNGGPSGSANWSSGGDVRNLAHLATVPANFFQPTPNYNSSVYFEYGLQSQGVYSPFTGPPVDGTLMSGVSYGSGTGPTSYNNGEGSIPDIPIGTTQVTNSSGQEGDWDNGFAWLADGSYLPKPDEGVTYTEGSNSSLWGYFVKAQGFQKLAYMGISPTLFSANRQVASAVEFGDIPTGVQRNLPWQTLLFRPARSYHMGGTTHPGAASPPDYLLLDLFQMPVVEPYAISEPFSTAGKVNMNYRMKPFSSYITRSTALRSVLESTLLTGIPKAAVYGYRPDIIPSPTLYSTGTGADTRFPLDLDQTLQFFEARFNGTDGSGMPPVFVSESEICNLDLVPQGYQANSSSLGSFWNTMMFTGDNSLERPYATIYPRLTTRSNTYTIHVYAEALSPAPLSGGWNESTGAVTGQWRGEYCLERYLDPNDPTIPDFLSADANLNTNYKFHTLYSKRFAP